MATDISTTCAAVDDTLLSEDGRISIAHGVLVKSVRQEPIIGIVGKSKGQWQDGLGNEYNIPTFERMLPAASESDWEAVSEAEDECLPPVEKITSGETLRAVSLSHKAIETADFCIEKVRTKTEFNTFLDKITSALAGVTSWVLTGRYLQGYRSIADHHMVMTLDGPVDADEADNLGYDISTAPNASLSQGVLDDIRTDMLREIGDDDVFMRDSANESTVLPLFIGDELSRNLIKDNDDIRQDVRFAYQGQGEKSPLMDALMNIMPNQRKAYGGWTHFILRYPPRYNIVQGVLTRVEPFLGETAATKGKKRPTNPAYKTARYEEVFPWHPGVMKVLEMQKLTSAGGRFNFSAVDTTGTFRWINEYHRDCNPDRNKGYFRSVFKNAIAPQFPELGYTLLVERCSSNWGLTSCYES